MTTKYDPALCERLIREAREDDALMQPAPWDCLPLIVKLYPDDRPLGSNAFGTVRTRNNLRAIAEQLEAQRALIAELEKRPLRTFDQIGADRMADEIAVLVQRKVISSRCPAADALLDYRDPPQSPRSDRLVELEFQRAKLGDAELMARVMNERDKLRAEIAEAREILGASKTETLKQAAERVEVAISERARERDAARAQLETSESFCHKYQKGIVDLERRITALLTEATSKRHQWMATLVEVERLTESLPVCAHCEKRSATCFGQYESEGSGAAACDSCCGHGNEDGWCVRLRDLPGWAATVNRNAGILANERDAMLPVMRAAEQLAANWRDTSGSAVSIDAINDACEATTAAVEAFRAAPAKVGE